jgi:uncharacterized protein YjdB
VTAVPNNGFTVIDAQLLASNDVEAAVATKDVAVAGTYDVTWTATPQQIAYIWLIAVQAPAPQPVTLQSISVAPVNPVVTNGQTAQFTATGHYSDGSTQLLTSGVSWKSSDSSVATIGPSGLASAVGAGTATVTAVDGNLAGSTTLTVTAAPITLQSISVGPVNPVVTNGQTAQFTATGHYSDGSTQLLTSGVSWKSSDTNIATIGPSGLASAVGAGTATVTAADGSLAGSTTLTVTAPPGTLQFSAASYSVNENQGVAIITVMRTGGSDGAVSVNFTTSNGSAIAGSDYTAASGTLTFAAGETLKTFTVAIIDDSTVEGNETINLTLSQPTGGALLGTLNLATLTIVDDDVTSRPGRNGHHFKPK